MCRGDGRDAISGRLATVWPQHPNLLAQLAGSPAVAIAVLIVLFTICVGCGSDQSSAERLRVARLNIAAEKFDQAIASAGSISQDDPLWPEAQVVVGDAYMRQQQFEQAQQIWQQLIDSDHSEQVERLHTFAGQCARELGQLESAERHFRKALEVDPDDTTALKNLAFLLSGSGRVWEAGELYRRLLINGEADFDALALLADLERPIELHAFFESLADSATTDTVVARGLAAHAFWDGRSEDALPQLQVLVAKHPDFIACQAMLGELLLQSTSDDFLAWCRHLPNDAWDHPGIWYVCGLYARTHQDLATAADCFRKAVQLQPTHRRAFNALGQTLYAQQHPEAGPVGKFAQQVLSVGSYVDDVLRTKTPDRFRNVIDALVATGRYWEACAWSVEALKEFPNLDWPNHVVREYSGKLDQPAFVDPDSLPKYVLGVSSEIDSETLLARITGMRLDESAAQSTQWSASIRFDDAVVGVPFVYQNGHDAATPGARFFEQTGGGVAVLDFDQDSRPDLFFPQGGSFNEQSMQFGRSAEQTDRLYRNASNSFRDMTEFALPADIGFGQGASAGDVNNDGFPDLYVANYEQNQLLINQGDGTFLPASADERSENQHWTASTAIADLNLDGHPELVDLNYLQGPQLLTAICDGKACSPGSFDPAPDVLRLSLGDGNFDAVSGAVDSKALGSVIWMDHVDRRMVMFIANDQVANHCLKFDVASGDRLSFDDLAIPVGLAFNEDGNRMGCMGIAAADFSENGRLDLFVTNFQNEANTLYVQDAPGLFIDQTKSSGLFPLSYGMVGWGTQALDADHDGHCDIIAVNGHVDDHRDQNKGYHMTPQFFRNRGQAQFEQPPAEQLGDFFKKKFLGRGLARFDWNADGADDFVFSSIRQPAMIVTNRTQHAGHFLDVRLTGTSVSRDAIGAQVHVETATREYHRHLTAGDGFMATNERRLQFGLGAETEVRRLRVTWPDGTETAVESPTADTTLHIVQQRGTFLLPP